METHTLPVLPQCCCMCEGARALWEPLGGTWILVHLMNCSAAGKAKPQSWFLAAWDGCIMKAVCSSWNQAISVNKRYFKSISKKSRCVDNCTSGSWKWKRADENRAGQKDITILLEFPQSWQLSEVYWTFIGRKQYYFLFNAVVREKENRQSSKWKINCAGSERRFYFNT